MTPAFARVPTGVLLVLASLTLLTGFTALSLNFEYPTVLRFPAATILSRFAAAGPLLIGEWYAMLLASLLFIPAGLLLHPLLVRVSAALAPLATGLIVLGGLVNALGFLRWPFLVPQLAAQAQDSGSTESSRQAALVVFQAFHTYAGVGIGEHLGFFFLGSWLMLAGTLLRRSRQIPAWLGWVWVGSGAGTLIGLLEPLGLGWAGLNWAGPVNAAASSLGMLAVLLTGALLLRRSQGSGSADAQALSSPAKPR